MSAVAALLLSLMGNDRLGDPTPPGVTIRYGTGRFVAGTDRSRQIVFHPTRDEVFVTPVAMPRDPDNPHADRFANGAGVVGWNSKTGKEVYRGERPLKEPTLTNLRFDVTGRFRLETVNRSSVRVWDTQLQREVATVRFDDSRIAIPLGLHGDRLAALVMESDKPRHSLPEVVARFRRVSDGKQIGHDIPVAHKDWTALSADGRTLLAYAGALAQYDTESGRLLRWAKLPHLPGTDLRISCQFSPDAKRFIVHQFRTTVDVDGDRRKPACFVHTFDTVRNQLISTTSFRLDDGAESRRTSDREVFDLDGRIEPLICSADGTCAAFVSERGLLRVRQLVSGRTYLVGSGCSTVAFSSDSRRLAYLDWSGVLHLVDPATGRAATTNDAPPTEAPVAAVSPDGKLVATGHCDGSVWMWESESGKLKWHTGAAKGWVDKIRFNSTGSALLGITYDDFFNSNLNIYDTKSGKLIGGALPCGYPKSAAVSADGKSVIDLMPADENRGEDDPVNQLVVRVRDIRSGKVLRRTPLNPVSKEPNFRQVITSLDGRVAFTDGLECAAFDTTTGNRLSSLTLPGKAAPCGIAAATPDGHLCVTTTGIRYPDIEGGETVTLFNTQTGRVTGPFKASNNLVEKLAMCPDGRYVIVTCEGQSLVIDLRNQRPVRELLAVPTAFFPDGKSVLSLPGIRGAERVSLEPLVWKVAPPTEPTAKRLVFLWDQLAKPGAAGLDAVFELARFPAVAVPFLKAKLLSDPPDPKVIARHIANLGAKAFADREEATKALRAFGPVVVPALRAARKADPSPETRARLDKLIATHADTATPLTLARLRAVEVLERCGGRAALNAVAEKQPGTPWADDAARALVRLKR